MITPWVMLAFIWVMAALVDRKVPVRCVPMIASQSLSGRLVIVPRVLLPALLTTIATGPSSASAVSYSRSMSAARPASAATRMARRRGGPW